MEIAIQRALLPMGHLQHLNTLLKVLELPNDLLSTVVLLFFPVLKNLYGSKEPRRAELGQLDLGHCQGPPLRRVNS